MVLSHWEAPSREASTRSKGLLVFPLLTSHSCVSGLLFHQTVKSLRERGSESLLVHSAWARQSRQAFSKCFQAENGAGTMCQE